MYSFNFIVCVYCTSNWTWTTELIDGFNTSCRVQNAVYFVNTTGYYVTMFAMATLDKNLLQRLI